jgi:predicted NUDIX family NTP pyrophosphohydrolase
MPQQEQVDVLIYRVREQGLEVFMVNPQSADQAPLLHQLATPSVSDHAPELFLNRIDLDPVLDANGDARKAIAIEADWHEIPSLRALMYEDYRVAKEKAKEHIRKFTQDMERGTYVAVKEAIKRVMPEQYAFLKELKDIVADKNQTKYI